jgi:hypothetical protein
MIKRLGIGGAAVPTKRPVEGGGITVIKESAYSV